MQQVLGTYVNASITLSSLSFLGHVFSLIRLTLMRHSTSTLRLLELVDSCEMMLWLMAKYLITEPIFEC